MPGTRTQDRPLVVRGPAPARATPSLDTRGKGWPPSSRPAAAAIPGRLSSVRFVAMSPAVYRSFSVYLFSLRLLQPSLVLIVGWNLSLAPPAKTDNTLIDSWTWPESISIHTFPVSLLNIFLLSRWLMLRLFPLHKSFSFARSITRASLGTRGLRAGSEAKWFRDPHFTETLPGPGWGPCGITCDAPDTTHQASFARNHKQDAKLQHKDCSWW